MTDETRKQIVKQIMDVWCNNHPSSAIGKYSLQTVYGTSFIQESVDVLELTEDEINEELFIRGYMIYGEGNLDKKIGWLGFEEVIED